MNADDEIRQDRIEEPAGGTGDADREPAAPGDEAQGAAQEAGGRHSIRARLSRWVGVKRLAAIGSGLVLLSQIVGPLADANDLTDLVGKPRYAMFASGPKVEIEQLLVRHYKAVGEQRYAEAFSDFSEVEQDRLGGLDAYAYSITSWCPAVSADVQDPVVNEIGGKTATASVNVRYEHTCGKSPHRFESRSKYVWHLVNVNGEWKLDERDSQQTVDPLYYNYPEETENGGETYLDFSGKGNLDSIRVSNAVDSAKNSCDEIVRYRLANIVDDRPDTTWQVAGTGMGQWVKLQYEEPIKVSRVGLVPGYAKTDPCDETDRFYQMYVVREARIEFSNGSSVEATFEREPKMQYVDVPDTRTDYVRVEILETYPPGDKPGGPPYDYTLGKAAISEIDVQGP